MSLAKSRRGDSGRTWSDYLQLRKSDKPEPGHHDADVRFYADTNGALRSIQSDGTDAAIGGGFTATHTREVVYGPSDTAIEDQQAANVPFAHQAADALLDYSSPTNPVFVDAGLYAVLIQTDCNSGPQESGDFQATISPTFADQTMGGVDAMVTSSLAVGIFPSTNAHLTAYFEAGDGLRMFVLNNSGLGGSLNFGINIGFVQRIY